MKISRICNLGILLLIIQISSVQAQTITEIIDRNGDGSGNTLDFSIDIAVDTTGNVYVAGNFSDNAFKITPSGSITEIIDATGDGSGNTLDFSADITVDTTGNVYVLGSRSDNAFKITPSGSITEIIDATGDGSGNSLDHPLGITVDTTGNVYVTGANSDNAFKIDFSSNVVLVSAVLPSSRSVTVGNTATAFATIINADSSRNALDCRITPITSVAADFFFQTTDPATNALTGTRDASVDISPGAAQAQTFVFGFTPTAAFSSTDVQLQFSCANANDASVVTGLNTLLLSASDTPIPDMVALVATVNNDGIVHIPGATGTGFFAVASVNVGASDMLLVSVDTGTATLPIVTSLCETDPATAACINSTTPITGVLVLTIDANATPTFSVFVTGTEDIALDAASKRIFLRFKDAIPVNRSYIGGETRGSTSVAVQTD